MRTYERNSVHVDQCTECRGIFLDRGELEKLVDAENSWHGGSPAAAEQGAAPAAPAPSGGAAPAAAASAGGLGAIVSEVLQQAKAAKSSRGSHDRGYDDRYDSRPDDRYDSRHDPRYGRTKKKKSFLDELFG